jgi:hypothetical protein
MLLVTLPHLVNVMVVTIIQLLIFQNHPAMTGVYGPDTPARRILTYIYATIALAAQFAFGQPDLSICIAAVLLRLQFAYKLATPVAAGPRNPVVISKRAIAAVHAMSLAALILA